MTEGFIVSWLSEQPAPRGHVHTFGSWYRDEGVSVDHGRVTVKHPGRMVRRCRCGKVEERNLDE